MDINDILDRPKDEIPEVKPLPTGVYEFQVRGSRTQTVGEDATPKLSWKLKTVGVVESEIDDSQLELTEPARFEHFLTDKSLAQRSAVISAVKFLDAIGVDGYSNLREGFEAAIGVRFKAKAEFKYVGKNKDIPITEINRVLVD